MRLKDKTYSKEFISQKDNSWYNYENGSKDLYYKTINNEDKKIRKTIKNCNSSKFLYMSLMSPIQTSFT